VEGREISIQDEIIYTLLFAGVFATILTSFIVPYVARQSQAADIIADVLWFTSLSLTLTAASAGVFICQ